MFACFEKQNFKVWQVDEKPDKRVVEEEELEIYTCQVCWLSNDWVTPQLGVLLQPGLTNYLPKLSHDFFGIVNNSNDSSVVYIFNERIGPKN